jgi:hypothetical protein
VNKLPAPLNANEQLLYGIAIRLEVLIDQMSALSEHIANKDKVSVESGNVEPAPKKTKRGVKNESGTVDAQST